jgi:hydrogenase 3 maturation protease
MTGLYEILEERLSGAGKITILGVGSFLNADDGAGVMITEKLNKHFSNYKLSATAIMTGENAPENYTGEIKKFRPDHLLVLDAVDCHREPGDILTIRPDEIGGVTFSTHMLPIKIMLDYISRETGCNITILGIQPGSLAFAGDMTGEVIDTIDYMISVLKKIIMRRELSCNMEQFICDSLGLQDEHS